MFTLADITDAAALVHKTLPPTPQIEWPLLGRRTGAKVWVKHENHTPIGAFKIRGGLVFMDRLLRQHPDARGVIAATRGNHGQGVAFAASRRGLSSTVVVPRGNNPEKNAAMAALGARLIEHGRDFQESLEYAAELAKSEGLHFVPSFDPALMLGASTYSKELLDAVPDLDALYVPIGLGSGICGAIAARDALGRKTEIIGVSAANAPAYALSFKAGRPVDADTNTIADGMACRVADPRALDIIVKGAARVIMVSEDELRRAMKILFTDTHNAAEGAGAAALAGLIQEREAMKGRTVGVVLSGANVDNRLFTEVLAA
ncbi:MAG: threonine dehydratase [Rhodospirillaceae bacterium]